MRYYLKNGQMDKSDCINKEMSDIIYDNPWMTISEAYGLAADSWDSQKAIEEAVYYTEIDYSGWEGDGE